jgi:hypothetical protein
MVKFKSPYARTLIVDVAPPILLRPMQKLWRAMHGRGSYTFEGCYPSFSDVPCTDSYNDDDFSRAYAAFNLEHRKSAAASGKNSVKSHTSFSR